MSHGCSGGVPMNDGRCPVCHRPYGECSACMPKPESPTTCTCGEENVKLYGQHYASCPLSQGPEVPTASSYRPGESVSATSYSRKPEVPMTEEAWRKSGQTYRRAKPEAPNEFAKSLARSFFEDADDEPEAPTVFTVLGPQPAPSLGSELVGALREANAGHDAQAPGASFGERVRKLDGRAVVNLAEPSAGDLERIYKCYWEKCEAYEALERELAELRGLERWNNSAAINKIKVERDQARAELLTCKGDLACALTDLRDARAELAKFVKFDAFLKDDGDVKAEVYEAAVKGRQDFRNALREERAKNAALVEALEKILYAGNEATLGKWDATHDMKLIAFETLAKFKEGK